jgi:hypothetical protein
VALDTLHSEQDWQSEEETRELLVELTAMIRECGAAITMQPTIRCAIRRYIERASAILREYERRR